MRLTTKFGAALATTILASVPVLGGAGIAQAQGVFSSLSSPERPSGVELTVVGDFFGVGGVATNNTYELKRCLVMTMDAEVVADIESLVDGGMAVHEAESEEFNGMMESRYAGKNASADLRLRPGETVNWIGKGSDFGPDEDYQAGAYIQCDDDSGGHDLFGFAYEPAGLSGSLGMGSLSS